MLIRLSFSASIRRRKDTANATKPARIRRFHSDGARRQTADAGASRIAGHFRSCPEAALQALQAYARVPKRRQKSSALIGSPK
jgi:hypothetical protein